MARTETESLMTQDKTAHKDPDIIKVRLARNDKEIRAAQRLRYPFFKNDHTNAAPDHEQVDQDKFDPIADHLIVVNTAIEDGPEGIVGTYRLIRQDIAESHGGFYTSEEFDISALVESGTKCLELGRSCVLEKYRIKPVIQKLWDGISQYVTENQIGFLFGCGSFAGTTNVEDISKQLAYLHHYHLAPSEIRPKALPQRYVDMNLHEPDELNKRAVFSSLPPLLKGYLRIGAFIGDGAVIDHDLNMIDVCIVLDTDFVAQRYKSHYEKRNKSPLPSRTISSSSHSEMTLSENLSRKPLEKASE